MTRPDPGPERPSGAGRSARGSDPPTSRPAGRPQGHPPPAGERPQPFWLFTPISAFGLTLVGVVVLFYLEPWALDLVLGSDRVCDELDCGLGVGVLLVVAGFFALVLAFLAGMVLGALRRDATPTLRSAVRRGTVVAAWCTLAYLAATVLIWWPTSR